MGITRYFIAIFFMFQSFFAFGQTEVLHTIVKGNTIYGLAITYGSSVDSIYEANPMLGVHRLAIGDTVVIPIPQKEIVDSSRYNFHKVRSFESVYSISNRYGLKDSTIYWHNTTLNNKPTVKRNEILRIPRDPYSWLKSEMSSDSLTSINQNSKDDTKARDTSETLDIIGILPFFTSDYINEGQRSKRSKIAFSYRQGIEMAISEFRDSNLLVDLKFYDSYNSLDSLDNIKFHLDSVSTDLILGPMYTPRVLQFKGDVQEENVVSLMSKQPIINSLDVWNSIVAEEYFWHAMRDKLVVKHYENRSDTSYEISRKLLVVGLQSGSSAAISRMLVENIIPADYLLVSNDKSWIQNEELGTLNAQNTYDIIITENDPAFILDVLRNLRSGSALYRWYTHEYQVFENGLVSNVFERENVYMFTSSYLDYDDIRVKHFVKKFREHYGRQPDNYAIEGYDNAKFHVQRVMSDMIYHRGIKKGFDYSDVTSRQNKFVELRKFEGLRWVRF